MSNNITEIYNQISILLAPLAKEKGFQIKTETDNKSEFRIATTPTRTANQMPVFKLSITGKNSIEAKAHEDIGLEITPEDMKLDQLSQKIGDIINLAARKIGATPAEVKESLRKTQEHRASYEEIATTILPQQRPAQTDSIPHLVAVPSDHS